MWWPRAEELLVETWFVVGGQWGSMGVNGGQELCRPRLGGKVIS